ncbi:MAG: hypothetical protein GWP91_14315 [Rhodobacterales bacterium]|nr:hypothetical protein [Rhodobacterales bacterium]
MKIAAHPLIVAAALGLLGPTVLEQDDLGVSEFDCIDCPHQDDAPSAQQMADLEAEWTTARLAVGE